jgi:hypothetical protein
LTLRKTCLFKSSNGSCNRFMRTWLSGIRLLISHSHFSCTWQKSPFKRTNASFINTDR